MFVTQNSQRLCSGATRLEGCQRWRGTNQILLCQSKLLTLNKSSQIQIPNSAVWGKWPSNGNCPSARSTHRADEEENHLYSQIPTAVTYFQHGLDPRHVNPLAKAWLKGMREPLALWERHPSLNWPWFQICTVFFHCPEKTRMKSGLMDQRSTYT